MIVARASACLFDLQQLLLVAIHISSCCKLVVEEPLTRVQLTQLLLHLGLHLVQSPLDLWQGCKGSILSRTARLLSRALLCTHNLKRLTQLLENCVKMGSPVTCFCGHLDVQLGCYLLVLQVPTFSIYLYAACGMCPCSRAIKTLAEPSHCSSVTASLLIIRTLFSMMKPSPPQCAVPGLDMLCGLSADGASVDKS